MLSKHAQERLLVGSIFSALVILIILNSHTALGKFFFMAGLTSITLLSVYEAGFLAKKCGHTPKTTLCLLFSFLYLFIHDYTLHCKSRIALHAVLFFLFLLISSTAYLRKKENAFANIAITLFLPIYITVPLSIFWNLNYLPPAPTGAIDGFWVLYTLITTKIVDIAAYFGGSFFGKTKLAPSVSSKKTIAGAVFGFIGAIASSMLFSFYGRPFLSYWAALFLGSIIGILSQLSDLVESLLKRDANEKDSSSLPGLGGFLDTVDSLLFVLPFVWIFLKFYGTNI